MELEPRFASLLPEVLIDVSPSQFAAIAAQAMVPKPVPLVMTDHVHAPQVSVSEHMVVMAERLRRQGAATFRALVSDCTMTIEVVARFLGLLELYKDGLGGLRPGRRVGRAARSLGRPQGRRHRDQHRRGLRMSDATTDEIAADELAAEEIAGSPADEVATDASTADVSEAEEQLPPVAMAQPVDVEQLAAALEAILFVVESPVTVAALAVAVQQPTDAVQGALDALRDAYDERGAGIEVRAVAGGVRIYTRAEHADVVEQFLQEGQRSRLTQAALETLAVIAYRQPVTRSRVSAIRGVNVDGVVRTLLARGLIVEVGTDPETGGGLFRTTGLFLEKMGLQSLDELPSLAPLLPDIEGLDMFPTDDV